MTTASTKYIELMNLGSPEEAHRAIKKMVSDLTDQEHEVRSSILELHAAVEFELRRIIYHTFKDHVFHGDDDLAYEKALQDLEKKVDRLSFMDMYRVLEVPLRSWPYPEFEHIGAINTLRSSVAHAKSIENISYKGRNPFRDPDSFAEVYFDVWAIKQAAVKYFGWTLERPKSILKRYIDKYGNGEI